MSCDSKAECMEVEHLCSWPKCQSGRSRQLEKNTAPTVSEAMREGILHNDVQALIAVAKKKVAERDARLAALERENATLRAERDELTAFKNEASAVLRDWEAASDKCTALIQRQSEKLATLRASAERMKAALEPFAKAADIVDEDATENWLPPHDDDCRIDPILPSGEAPFLAFVGDLRRERAVLTPKETSDA